MYATTDLNTAQNRGAASLARARQRTQQVIQTLNSLFDRLVPAADLLIRLWIANVFWKAGLSKIQSMESTILLFRYEYNVPLLAPEIAAYLATFSELGFSVLLALGLAGRLSALSLFILNAVAVISYPALQAHGLIQHQLWGLLLLVTLLHGPGRLSLDYLLARKLGLNK
ncbi:MAG: DoxX family protein [Candidatus Competibacteraceae bacterium]|nr:DoxX family protein [Candidatus Competibacteraceae bacterium]